MGCSMKVQRISNHHGRLTSTRVAQVSDQLADTLSKSRFTARLELMPDGFKVLCMRLRSRKPYCGSHPDACELGGIETSRRTCYLEGADWVEFNDLLNNFFDRRRLSARIASVACIVRKYELRRTHYGSYSLGRGNRIWNYDEPAMHYSDNRGGKPMISDFPDGTPGIYQGINYHVLG